MHVGSRIFFLKTLKIKLKNHDLKFMSEKIVLVLLNVFSGKRNYHKHLPN